LVVFVPGCLNGAAYEIRNGHDDRGEFRLLTPDWWRRYYLSLRESEAENQKNVDSKRIRHELAPYLFRISVGFCKLR
jgi:hypothetical protein